MSSYIHHEMLLFLQAAGMGALLLLCYDFLSSLRNALPHHPAAVAIEDLVYWLCTGLFVFVRVYRSNEGILRSFLFLGIFLGALLCHGTVSPLFVKICTKILAFPVLFIKKLLKRLLFSGRRCKIFLYKLAKSGQKKNKAGTLRKRRGSQVEKVEKKKRQKQNSL